MKAKRLAKFRLLRHKKRAQKYLKNYHLVIALTAFTLLAFSNIGSSGNNASENINRGLASVEPRAIEKTNQKPIIDIKINYEELSNANLLHMSSIISSSFLTSESAHYKWKKLENVQLISGNLEGDLDNISDAQEVDLDIAVKNSLRPAKISLEVSSISNGAKYSSEKTITIGAKKLINQ